MPIYILLMIVITVKIISDFKSALGQGSFLYKIFIAALLPLILSSCTSRLELAQDIAFSAHSSERKIISKPFVITVFEHIKNKGKPANIYIEGDGFAWVDRFTPSIDPTPSNPVALKLAALDEGENVIYMARPCQYSKMSDAEKPCEVKYWTSKRFAPEVISSMNNTLDEIKQRYKLKEFNLIGFSGGAAVAILIAAKRNDVASIRSIAGNLDHEVTNRIHNVSQLDGSLNPADVARQVANIPQHHFLGKDDEIITAEVYQSYRKTSGDSHCLRFSFVEDASHENGWDKKWKSLLKVPLYCSN